MTQRLTYSLLTAAALAACSAPVDDDADAQAASSQAGSYGLVVLTHEFAEPGVEVSAQLLDYVAPSRTDALHALAVPVEAWLLQAPRRDGCRLLTAPYAHEGHVDLLSAGPLSVAAPEPLEHALSIEPSAFPALRFALSGVVYDADATQALPYLARGEYRVSAAGAEVGDFTARVPSADPIWLRDLTQSDEGLTLRWGGSGRAHVVVARDTATQSVGVVCTSDADTLTIDHEALQALGLGEAQVVIARLTRTPIEIDGLDAAEAVFVARDTVHIDLAPEGSADEIEDPR